MESQISTMSSDIKGVSKHINKVQYKYMHPVRQDQEFDSFGHAQRLSVGFSRRFVENPKMPQITGLDSSLSQNPLSQTGKPITEQP